MDRFTVYFSNLNYLAIIDLTICLVCLALSFLFFYHKRSLRVFYLIISIVALKVVADVLNSFLPNESLLVTSNIMRYVVMFLLFTIAIVYKADFRSIFQRIATPNDIDLFYEGFGSDDELHTSTNELLSALQVMAKQDIGAIIIITPTTIDSNILETGTFINAIVSASLLVSIFNTKAPLHDGAVIIKGNRILSAGCFLPLTQETGVDKELGTRHRAALGITEESDVIAIVVSEETGIISIAHHGQMQRYMTIEKLKEKIETIYGISTLVLENKVENTNTKKKKRFFK